MAIKKYKNKEKIKAQRQDKIEARQKADRKTVKYVANPKPVDGSSDKSNKRVDTYKKHQFGQGPTYMGGKGFKRKKQVRKYHNSTYKEGE